MAVRAACWIPAATLRMKRYLAPLLKASVAAAILVWMSRSGKLNWSQMAGALVHWPDLVFILAAIFVQIAMTAWRWMLLLRAQGFSIGLNQAFQLNMIGSLFSTIIPGAVGGDVMKAYYVTRSVPTHKAEAIATIVLDRLIGLVGLLVLAAGIALYNLHSVKGNQALTRLCVFAVVGTCGSLTAMFLAVRFGPRFAADNPTGRMARLYTRVLTGLDRYRRKPLILPASVLVSILCHASVCYALFLAMHAINAAPVPLGVFLLAAPLGLLATAIPIAPAGIGVGQVAFFSLFQILAPASARDAVNAFTVFQSLALLACLSGFIPYLAYKGELELAVNSTPNAGEAK
jgi:glycosyltransferase 2 family protein